MGVKRPSYTWLPPCLAVRPYVLLYALGYWRRPSFSPCPWRALPVLLSPAPAAVAADGSFSAPAIEIAPWGLALRLGAGACAWGLALRLGAGACACGSCSRDCPSSAGPAMRLLASLPDANGGRVAAAEAMATGPGVRSTPEAVE